MTNSSLSRTCPSALLKAFSTSKRSRYYVTKLRFCRLALSPPLRHHTSSFQSHYLFPTATLASTSTAGEHADPFLSARRATGETRGGICGSTTAAEHFWLNSQHPAVKSSPECIQATAGAPGTSWPRYPEFIRLARHPLN